MIASDDEDRNYNSREPSVLDETVFMEEPGAGYDEHHKEDGKETTGNSHIPDSMPAMATEAYGEEEVDSGSSTLSVYESGEGNYHQDYFVLEHVNFSDKVPRKGPLGYQNFVVAKDYFVSQDWVRHIRMQPNMTVKILVIYPQKVTHADPRQFQPGMVPGTHRANVSFDKSEVLHFKSMVWLTTAMRGYQEFNLCPRGRFPESCVPD